MGLDSIELASIRTQRVSEIINQILADEIVLYQKTLNFHWNATGPHFILLHELFETQYEELQSNIDAIAERCREIGGHPIGTLKEVMTHAHIGETPGHFPMEEEMIQELVSDHRHISDEIQKNNKRLADEYEDFGTQELLIQTSRFHDKSAWMLSAMIEGFDGYPDDEEE